MSKQGKYVRRYRFSDDEDEAGSHDELPEAGRYVRAPKYFGEVNDNEDVDHQYDDYEVRIDPNKENEMLKQQLSEMTKAIASLSKTKSSQERNVEVADAEESWTCSRHHLSLQTNDNAPSARWDQMKPFPKNIPANKMWEEWTKYIENFEIAASLSNATDPVRLCKLLFYSMGDELQGIVRAAKLKSNLNDEHCYKIFIKNIEEHLLSLTDTSAEHEAFSRMQQERGETAVNFHARLTDKARLCRYNPSDQGKFIRTQLLKGKEHFNQGLKKREYVVITAFIHI